MNTNDLIKAYEEGENMLDTIEFNFNKSREEIKSDSQTH